MVHIGKGIVLRLDDHFDITFLVQGFARVVQGSHSFKDFKAKVDKRIPGTTFTSISALRAYIWDFVVRALWPWRTILIVTNPNEQGGIFPQTIFTSLRMDVLQGEVLML